METALAFPEPLPEDPEVVATALETAGIFGVQGDVREAVRWVRRAAELAGDAGIDDRAFALARAAADLTSNFSARVESAPPPAAPAQSAPADGATVGIASAPPPPPPPPVVAQSRPSAPQDSRPPHQAVSVSPIVSLGVRAAPAPAAEDEGEITSQHPPRRARPSDSAPPVQAQPTAQPALAAPAPAPAPAPARGGDALAALFEESPVAQTSAAPAPAGGRPLAHTIAYQSPPDSAPVAQAVAKLEEPPTPAPEQTVRYPSEPARPNFAEPPRHAQSSQHLVATQVYEPVQPEAAFVEEAVPVMEATVNAAEPSAPIAAAPQSASARQAARASIEQSQEEGVYILRLLKNGDAAAFGTFEALVVLVDPGAELFTGA